MSKLDECIKNKVDPALLIFESPTAGVGKVSSNYMTNNRPNHRGVDVEVQEGTKIYAVEYGIVWRVMKNHSEYGNCIIIRHSNNLYSLYAHLEPEGILVRKNECVEIGDIVGLSGNTGRSTGPHLHFEVIRMPEGRQLSQVALNSKGEPAVGILGSEYRIDPSFVFSNDRASLLKVEKHVVQRASAMPLLLSNAAVFVAMVTAWNFASTAVAFWIKGLSTVAANLGATSLTYSAVRSSLERKEQEKWNGVRASININVTPEMVRKQLVNAESTGKRSPNQQRKIENEIRADIKDAKDAAGAASGLLRDLQGDLSDVQREIASVERDALLHIGTEQEAIRRREDVERRMKALREREKEIEVKIKDASGKIGMAADLANEAAARNDVAIKKAQDAQRDGWGRDDVPDRPRNNGNNNEEKETVLEIIDDDSSYETIILRVDPIDDHIEDLSNEVDLDFGDNGIPLVKP